MAPGGRQAISFTTFANGGIKHDHGAVTDVVQAKEDGVPPNGENSTGVNCHLSKKAQGERSRGGGAKTH